MAERDAIISTETITFAKKKDDDDDDLKKIKYVRLHSGPVIKSALMVAAFGLLVGLGTAFGAKLGYELADYLVWGDAASPDPRDK